ncbi:hypothetical protein CFIO01_07976 [Colletotrichum fioriniae PJ7]|uniref:F-box domain-containing protein n=1 Tax=Colletotrichum fioriniae PJ7 TaxID=1445577 RepID=A0A010R7B6_9PEZI|nr:hypothetical protein CFIO01_07976 [Colletotrichum fioriniae PJ7]
MDMNDKMELLEAHALTLLSHSCPTLQQLTRSANSTQKRHLPLKTRTSRVCLRCQQVIIPPRSPAEPNVVKNATRRVEAQAQQTLAIIDLPPELHHSIMDFLDPIDSTCLGLASRHFYTLHRRRHGTVHLSTRPSRPNDQEWAWRLASTLSALESINTTTATTAADDTTLADEQPISYPQPRPPFWCEKCGLERCELQRHIRDWLPRDHKYCTISGKFVRLGLPRGAEGFCHRRSPRNSRLCGKHHPRSIVGKVVREATEACYGDYQRPS